MQLVLNNFNDKIIQPLDTFYQNLSTVYTGILDEFHNIKSSVIETKLKLEKAKQQYKDSAIFVNDLLSKPPEIIDKDTLIKAQNVHDNYKKLYNYELNEANKLFTIYNKKYIQLHTRFYANEESRISFLSDIISKFSIYLIDYNQTNQTLNTNLQSLMKSINIQQEIDIIKKDFHYSFYGERFRKEDFEEFTLDRQSKINLRNFNNILTETPKSKEETSTNKVVNINNSQIQTTPQIMLDMHNQNDFLSTFINDLFGPNEVPVENLSKIMEVLYNNLTFSKEFVNIFISVKKSAFYIFSNLNNLQNLANIFSTISLNFEHVEQGHHDINFAIVFIACKTYCLNTQTGEKTYLCALLSQNKSYQTKGFWIDLIEFKLARKLEEHLLHLMKIDIVRPTENKDEDKSMFSFRTLTKVFTGKDNKEQSNANPNNKYQIKKYVLENTGLSQYIEGYKKLPDYKKPFLDQFASNEVHLIIVEFIPYICNFNFKNEDAIDLVVDVSTRYKVSKDKLNYYVANIGAWCNSIKRKLPNTINNIVLIDKIKHIRDKRHDLIKVKYPLIPSKNEQKKIMITAIAKYLPMNELINIFLLNKYIYTRTRIKIFKELLNRNNISLSTRLQIWNCILNITTIKNKYKYDLILSEMQTKKSNGEEVIPSSILDVIEMDVKRTSFAKNEKESKAAISSILKAIAYIKPQLNYCQGMNYICSFMFQILQNEKETFYLMMGFIDKSDFASLFMENLQNLKRFFFMFERELQIVLPESYNSLQLANVNVDFFSPPWFLTLFTNTATIVDLENLPLVVLKIWDLFFIKGFRVLISTGLSIIKVNENKLANFHTDDMIQFLISTVPKSDFFKNKNYKEFEKIIKEMNISKKMVINLETEYNFKKKENEIK